MYIAIIVLILVLASVVIMLRNDNSYDGYWKSEGYSLILVIKKGKVTSYQVAGNNLVPLPLLDGHVKNGTYRTKLVSLTFQSTTHSLSLFNQYHTLMFNVERIMGIDNFRIIEPTNDPVINFEIFTTTFRDNYPFFDLYEVDWDQQVDALRENISPTMSNNELWKVMKTLIAPMNDDHIYISKNDHEHSPYQDLPTWFKEKKAKQFVTTIKEQYIQGYQESKDRLVRYGQLNNTTGYILLASMGGYSNEEKAVKAISKSFNQALESFHACQNIVIDLRFNRGGYDQVGLSLAGYFTQSESLAYSRLIRDKGKDTPLYDVSVIPQDNYYDKTIYVLTSGATVSAAETFLIALKNVTTVTLIGEESAGFYSDMLERQLPNGMTFGLPHQKYFDVNGRELEADPLPPHYYASFNEEAIDRALEQVNALTS